VQWARPEASEEPLRGLSGDRIRPLSFPLLVSIRRFLRTETRKKWAWVVATKGFWAAARSGVSSATYEPQDIVTEKISRGALMLFAH
jgi:hypothetical protein